MPINVDVWQSAIDLANRSTFLRILEPGLMSIVFLVSTVGNVASCMIMYQNPRLRNWHNMLLLNVMVTDLVCTVVCVPFIIVVLVEGRWPLGHVLCHFTSFAACVALVVSTTTLATISISRYLFVKKITLYLTIFKKRNVVAMIVSIWVLAPLSAAPPLVGWGNVTFLPGNAMCFIHFQGGLLYGAIFTLVFIGVPLAVISVCFIKLCLLLRKHKRSTKTATKSSRNSIGSAEISSVKSLLSLLVMVLFCWLPLVVVLLCVALGMEQVPRQVSLASTFLATISFAIKPFFYFFMKKEFRMELRKLYRGKRVSLRKEARVHPS